MKKKNILVGMVALVAAWQVADACGPWLILRPALNARFWQPSVRRPDEMLDGVARTRAAGRAYAGMGGGGSAALEAARSAYQRVARWRVEHYGWWSAAEGEHLEGSLPRAVASAAREAVQKALAANPPRAEAEELLLIDCKVSLREAESLLRGDRSAPGFAERRRAALEKARTELTNFLQGARTPALSSEARGWLARCHYLLGEEHRAARLYLDELARPDSVLSREGLLLSMSILFPYNGSAAGLSDHLEEYFDTPQHALFVVSLVTNPVVNDEGERRAMSAVGQKALLALERHRGLFAKGEDGDRLALAAMRASLYLGDPGHALEVAAALPAGSKAAGDPEAHWMRGVAHFLLKQYAEAEPHLLAVATAPRAPAEPRDRARLGLLAVYQKLDRPVDQLLAAARYEAIQPEDQGGTHGWYLGWTPMGGWLMDLSYLLDVQLTDEELRAARARLAAGPALQVDVWDERKENVLHLVDYALAVRAARREDYAAAGALYARLGKAPRAARMKAAERLHDAVGASGDLEPRFAYASFLADHPGRLFFNDSLWEGFQRYALLRKTGDADMGQAPALLDEEQREALLANERRFQDAQEERWRAFQIFDAVAQGAGHSALGRRAALKALECLVQLADNSRFGRTAEIRAARRRLTAWLRATPAEAS